MSYFISVERIALFLWAVIERNVLPFEKKRKCCNCKYVESFLAFKMRKFIWLHWSLAKTSSSRSNWNILSAPIHIYCGFLSSQFSCMLSLYSPAVALQSTCASFKVFLETCCVRLKDSDQYIVSFISDKGMVQERKVSSKISICTSKNQAQLKIPCTIKRKKFSWNVGCGTTHLLQLV